MKCMIQLKNRVPLYLGVPATSNVLNVRLMKHTADFLSYCDVHVSKWQFDTVGA